MQGFFTSLRLGGAVRHLLTGAAAAPTAPVRAATAGPTRALPLRAAAAPAASAPLPPAPGRAPRALPAQPASVATPVVAAPTVADEPTATVTPSVPVAAKHLVDPVGLRVVPYRPVTRWPLRRAAPRVLDPFRGFPKRALVLGELMYGPRHRG